MLIQVILDYCINLCYIINNNISDSKFDGLHQVLCVSFSQYDKSWRQKYRNISYFLCWSLAALSEFILPYIADDDGNNYKFYLSKDGLDRWIAYYKSDDVSIYICEESDNMIDVILEMVCWLKKEEYI